MLRICHEPGPSRVPARKSCFEYALKTSYFTRFLARVWKSVTGRGVGERVNPLPLEGSNTHDQGSADFMNWAPTLMIFNNSGSKFHEMSRISVQT